MLGADWDEPSDHRDPQEAGLDGFWLHRVFAGGGTREPLWCRPGLDRGCRAADDGPRRSRIDGEALLRALLAYKRGEPRVCSMVRPPTPEAEDERRICRERAELIGERVRHVNRIKGLLFSQGVRSTREPLRRGSPQAAPRTAHRRRPAASGLHLESADRARAFDRLELLLEQVKTVEGFGDAGCSTLPVESRKARTQLRPLRRIPRPSPCF